MASYNKICASDAMFEDMTQPKKLGIEWASQFSLMPTEHEFSAITCVDVSPGKLIQILPNFTTDTHVSCYHNCYKTVLVAVFRQIEAVCRPTVTFLNDFSNFFDSILVEIDDCTKNLMGSFNIYWNHLTLKQQKEIDDLIDMDEDDPKLFEYSITPFCKCDKQLGFKCKCRAISAVNRYDKFLLGPICYDAEHRLRKAKFKGYSIGLNWKQKIDKMNEWKARDFKIVSTDLRGFDRTNDMFMKRIVHHKTYKLLFKNATKLLTKNILKHCMSDKVKLIISHKLKNFEGSIDEFVNIIGTVFSGKSCTTLLNTIMMIALLRFIAEKYLNLTPEQYDLQVSGDDGNLALPSYISDERIKNAYDLVFVNDKMSSCKILSPLAAYGSGMCIKTMTIGDTETTNFCSTHVYYCAACQNHFFTRDLEKFVKLTSYSVSATQFNSNQLQIYSQNLYYANSLWINNLPIFRAVNERLRTDAIGNLDSTIKPSKSRRRLDQQEQLYFDEYFKEDNDEIVNTLKYSYTKDDFYSNHGKIQNISDCCVNSFVAALEIRYGLSIKDIEQIEDQILELQENAMESRLDEAFVFNNNYNQQFIYN